MSFRPAVLLRIARNNGTNLIPEGFSPEVDDASYEGINPMPDKVTMINLVWMAMMGAMLATSLGFHTSEDEGGTFYGPPITARYHSFGH
ncbi:hypothetical protein HGO38_14710 [Rhizobium sp. CG5]|uniref:hypothetical protein n=1 Tax=Rhizobium sp. CG5 TaxID=2726076 RepID=UPI0020333E06|nr:hypothetical protein [Rhizobium sp. CG5]MCM2474729.1 hypothetical protein [Rhizobium sp. CG5]